MIQRNEPTITFLMLTVHVRQYMHDVNRRRRADSKTMYVDCLSVGMVLKRFSGTSSDLQYTLT